jgi:hypothetical protein
MYNTLDTTLGFLQKEVKLLNSISENFHEAMRSSQSKVEFSKQFETIVHGVEVRVQIVFLLSMRCSVKTCRTMLFGAWAMLHITLPCID